jgi:very-short-patch-repair endonuclease
MTRIIKIPNLDNLIKRYVAGESENKIAGAAGVNRWTMRKRLVAAGVHIRSQSEAETLKWSRMSTRKRSAQVKAAHAAAKDRVVSDAEKIRRSISHEHTLDHATPVELEFAGRLRKRELDVTPQRAVHFYNLDVAVNTPTIAVEIFGGGFHAYGEHLATHFRRTKHLLDLGWSVLIIWIDAKRYPLSVACDDYVVKFVEELSLNPSKRGEYRVIRGDGNPAPIRHTYLNTPADIERLGRGD